MVFNPKISNQGLAGWCHNPMMNISLKKIGDFINSPCKQLNNINEW